MLSDVLKIITSLETINVNEDERFNATGEKYVVVGEHDGQIGVVDEFGKVKKMKPPIEYSVRGRDGNLTINSNNDSLIFKWGRLSINETNAGETTHTITYDEPFPTLCQTLHVTQNQNNQMTGFMAKPVDNTKFELTVTGGNAGEEISFLAIGY